ncbi:MAG: carbohydrate binding family 9 domain-containing protein [bacterium]|nr:carbohydrate binding family 9 domain-containing protein [bacterium]
MMLLGASGPELWGNNNKIYRISRLDSAAPVIDGRIDDPAWKGAEWGRDFIQKSPYEGTKPSQETAFKILYDRRNIYIGIRAFDTEPEKITRRLTRRDSLDSGDWVEVVFDSYHDRRTGFIFLVNAAGVKSDSLVSNDGDNWDDNWDPIWQVKTAIDAKGWTAEMSIPFSQLRFGYREKQTWGLYVGRFIHRKQEISEWKLIPQKASGWVSLFGQLQGLEGVKPKRPVELVPYTVGNYQRFEKEMGNPFIDGQSSDATGGLDGKIGLSSDLTLDFTINPDFGQVEADPSEVNLTAFETFFEEKRPFFVEGRNILDYKVSNGGGPFSQDNLFYSRRIGQSIHNEPDAEAGEHVDVPDNITILGAFKVTGKTRGGLSIGIMESVTSREYALVDDRGRRRKEQVEPLTNYFALRLHKDYNRGKTGIGGMFTATNRHLGDDSHSEGHHKSAYTGGLDFFHYWKNKEWTVTLNTVFSRVNGDKNVISDTQQSPLRYYQRPDADYLTWDPNRTSLSGHGGDFTFGKTGGGRLRTMVGAVWRSPGLELNDAGFLRKADQIMQWFWVGYRITEPFGAFQNIDFNFNQYRLWNFGGERIYNGGNINFSVQFKNYWIMELGAEPAGRSLSNGALRGGPSLMEAGGWNYWLNIGTDTRKKLRLSLGGNIYSSNADSTRLINIRGGLTYQPFNALSLIIEPSFTDNKQNLQYVDMLDVPDQLETDHPKRYVFGRIDQKTLDLTLRLNFSITPDLSIQFYGQPFISTGKYSDFKHITQPRAEVFNDRFHLYNPDEIRYDPGENYYYVDEAGAGGKSYSFENPDFKFLQFRSNLVVRWEYIPGSTVYLVWSQGRTDTESHNVDFSPTRGLRDLFRIQPHNVFLVKFTYRFKI